MEREEEEAFVERRLQELGQTEGKGNDGRFCLDVRKWEAIGREGWILRCLSPSPRNGRMAGERK